MPSEVSVTARYRPRRIKLRSRVGCRRCKRRRQKCDETRPECGRCFRAAVPCVYEEILQRRRPLRLTTPEIDSDANQNITNPQKQKAPVRLSRPLGMRPLLGADPFDAQLLVYFIREASGAISCHERLQMDTFQALVSVGAHVPCLWYSTLLFSALHWATSGRTVARAADNLDVQILSLRSKTLRTMQSATNTDDSLHRDAIMATALMLTMSEIHFEPEAGTWRTHWLWMKRTHEPYSTGQHDTALGRFVWRRFSVVDFLASLPTSPNRAGRDLPAPTLPPMDHVGIIDGTLACSTDLHRIFRCIGNLIDQMNSPTADESTVRSAGGMARSLLVLVEAMMARDREVPPQLSEDVRAVTTERQVTEYQLCSQAAQHMALICIYRYLLARHWQSACVQQSIREIVRIASVAAGHSAVSPAICLVTPLFIAGCEAELPEQDKIAVLLESQYSVTGSRNTSRTVQVLKNIWRHRNAHSDSGRRTLDAPPAIPSDFLPY